MKHNRTHKLTALSKTALTLFLTLSPFGSASEHVVAQELENSASNMEMVVNDLGLGLFRFGGVPAGNSRFVFWGNNWEWAATKSQMEVEGPYEYTITGRNPNLDFLVGGSISRTSSSTMKWNLQFDVNTTATNVVGGGIEFKFDLALLSDMGTPEILPDKSGWYIGDSENARFTLTFDPPPAKIYFERNSRSNLRVLLFANTIPAGTHNFDITANVPQGMKITQTNKERYELDTVSQWSDAPYDPFAAPVDLSFLNNGEKPAGKHGFMRAVGEKLVFEDGTEARFWGTNITASALYKTGDDRICRQAERLAAFGYNLVRIHHHDSQWVNPNIFGGNKINNTQNVSAESKDKLDRWVSCLKDQGIYIALDLHVERKFRELDNISGFDELKDEKGHADLKGYNYLNESMQQAMMKFNEDYLSRINPYTGLAFKNDPAIISMLITNENDLTSHYGNRMLPENNVPFHSGMYMAASKDFAAEHNLSENDVWKAWTQGAAKLFLNDLEHEFNERMIAHLRSIGVKVPLATTNLWGKNVLTSLPSLTDGDFIDVHSYANRITLESNPVYASNFLHFIGAGQVAGKPVTITEWNSGSQWENRGDLPLYTAAMANYQGWDALMHFAYSQIEIGPNYSKATKWNSYNDPTLLALMPAAALLYRQQHVQEAQKSYHYSPDSKQFFYQYINAQTSPMLRTAMESGKFSIGIPQTSELPWLDNPQKPSNAEVLTNYREPVISKSASSVVSDTGELERNWQEGIYTIDTPLTQSAMGWIGDKDITLSDIRLKLTTNHATIAVQSLDGVEVRNSRKILITLGAVSVLSNGSLPFRVQPLDGELYIVAPGNMRLVGYSLEGNRVELPMSYRQGQYVIDLANTKGLPWLVMEVSSSMQTDEEDIPSSAPPTADEETLGSEENDSSENTELVDVSTSVDMDEGSLDSGDNTGPAVTDSGQDNSTVEQEYNQTSEPGTGEIVTTVPQESGDVVTIDPSPGSGSNTKRTSTNNRNSSGVENSLVGTNAAPTMGSSGSGGGSVTFPLPRTRPSNTL